MKEPVYCIVNSREGLLPTMNTDLISVLMDFVSRHSFCFEGEKHIGGRDDNDLGLNAR